MGVIETLGLVLGAEQVSGHLAAAQGAGAPGRWLRGLLPEAVYSCLNKALTRGALGVCSQGHWSAPASVTRLRARALA